MKVDCSKNEKWTDSIENHPNAKSGCSSKVDDPAQIRSDILRKNQRFCDRFGFRIVHIFKRSSALLPDGHLFPYGHFISNAFFNQYDVISSLKINHLRRSHFFVKGSISKFLLSDFSFTQKIHYFWNDQFVSHDNHVTISRSCDSIMLMWYCDIITWNHQISSSFKSSRDVTLWLSILVSSNYIKAGLTDFDISNDFGF